MSVDATSLGRFAVAVVSRRERPPGFAEPLGQGTLGCRDY